MQRSLLKVFHVSPIYNRASIMRHGIVPTPIRNKTHKNAMTEDGVATNDGRAVYTWLDSEKNAKYIRDLIYAITWIHPRNHIGDYLEEQLNDWVKFHDIDHRRPIWHYDQMVFDVYAIDAFPTDEHYDYNYYHVQEPAPDSYNTAAVMHDEFAHDDKKLVIYKEPLKSIQIVGQALYRYDEPNNSFTIKIIR